MRKTSPLSSSSLIEGAVAESEIEATPAGIVTDCTIAFVSPEHDAPMMPTTWSTFTTLLPASTPAFGSHCPSAAISTILRPSSSPPCALMCSAARLRPAMIGATSSAIGPVIPATEPTGTSSCASAGAASSAPTAVAERSLFMLSLPLVGLSGPLPAPAASRAGCPAAGTGE